MQALSLLLLLLWLLLLLYYYLQVKQVRIEYEYKLMLQPQQLAEQLREVNAARAAAERARDESTDELNVLKASMADQQERFLADMEAQHAVATEQLEAAYDNRFSVSLPLSGTMAVPLYNIGTLIRMPE